VKYVINVTDVDDKIINRARRNYLMEQYHSTATDLDKVRKFGTVFRSFGNGLLVVGIVRSMRCCDGF
jgi:cysteinyl-tRNA synthetase